MDFPTFCERTQTQEISPELEGVYSTIVALHGEVDSYVILGAVALLFKAGVPRFVIDRVVLALSKRSPEQLDLTLFGIIKNNILYFNNKSIGLDIEDNFAIAPGFPVITEDIIPTISLLVSVGAVRQDLGL
jgi:hypothetical protein